jgi:hypothetical protein
MENEESAGRTPRDSTGGSKRCSSGAVPIFFVAGSPPWSGSTGPSPCRKRHFRQIRGSGPAGASSPRGRGTHGEKHGHVLQAAQRGLHQLHRERGRAAATVRASDRPPRWPHWSPGRRPDETRPGLIGGPVPTGTTLAALVEEINRRDARRIVVEDRSMTSAPRESHRADRDRVDARTSRPPCEPPCGRRRMFS